MHADEPASEKLPAGHTSVHSDELRPRVAPKVPAGHCLHTLAPSASVQKHAQASSYPQCPESLCVPRSSAPHTESPLAKPTYVRVVASWTTNDRAVGAVGPRGSEAHSPACRRRRTDRHARSSVRAQAAHLCTSGAVHASAAQAATRWRCQASDCAVAARGTRHARFAATAAVPALGTQQT